LAENGKELYINTLEEKTLAELYGLAKDYDIKGYSLMKKKELIFAILKAATEKDGHIFAEGVLETMAEGYGFLRAINYLPSSEDIYISASQIRRLTCVRGIKYPVR
jgi:transcription termination factor Rho